MSRKIKGGLLKRVKGKVIQIYGFLMVEDR